MINNRKWLKKNNIIKIKSIYILSNNNKNEENDFQGNSSNSENINENGKRIIWKREELIKELNEKIGINE